MLNESPNTQLLLIFYFVFITLCFIRVYINYTGPAPICYLPVPPPGAIRGPHPPRFMPHPLNPGAPLLPSETHTFSLRDNIIKQIEYYFR